MVDYKILNYINEQLSKGRTKDEIKKALLYTGWPENYVNEALSYKPEIKQIIKDKPKKRRFSTLIFVIILSITIIGLALSYIFIFSDIFNKETSNENLNQHNNENLNPEETPNEDLNHEEEITNKDINLSERGIEMLSLNKNIAFTKDDLTIKYKEKFDDGYILSIGHIECGELDILLRNIYLYECYEIYKTIILENSLSSENMLTISII